MDPINDCSESPEWVVLGAQVLASTVEAVPVVLACCERHRLAVEEYQDTGIIQPERYPVHLAEAVVAGLLEGGDLWAGPGLISA